MHHVAPRHILELSLEVIIDHKIRIKTTTLVFSSGSCNKSLSLPRNHTGEKDIFLELSRDKIMIVLKLSRDKIMT